MLLRFSRTSIRYDYDISESILTSHDSRTRVRKGVKNVDIDLDVLPWIVSTFLQPLLFCFQVVFGGEEDINGKWDENMHAKVPTHVPRCLVFT